MAYNTSIHDLTYNAATQTYEVTFTPSSTGPGYTDDSGTRTVSYTPADIKSTAGDYTTYQRADDADPTYTDEMRLFKRGAENSTIALSHVSFGIQEVYKNSSYLQRDYFLFGTPTTSVPTTGTASYTGVLEGTYDIFTTGKRYLLSGAATLTADFAGAKVATTMNFTGTNVVSGGEGLSTQTFNGTGAIGALGTNMQFSGLFTGMGLPDTGYFGGSFYGDNAEEFGYIFQYFGAADRFGGVVVGKK